METPQGLDLRAPENRIALMVARFVVRSALTWFVAVFLFGGFAGWSVAQWSVTRIGAVLGLALASLAAVGVGLMFNYTNGTMATRLGREGPEA